MYIKVLLFYFKKGEYSFEAGRFTGSRRSRSCQFLYELQMRRNKGKKTKLMSILYSGLYLAAVCIRSVVQAIDIVGCINIE